MKGLTDCGLVWGVWPLGSECMIQGEGFRVQSSECKVPGSVGVSRIQGFGFEGVGGARVLSCCMVCLGMIVEYLGNRESLPTPRHSQLPAYSIGV